MCLSYTQTHTDALNLSHILSCEKAHNLHSSPPSLHFALYLTLSIFSANINSDLHRQPTTYSTHTHTHTCALSLPHHSVNVGNSVSAKKWTKSHAHNCKESQSFLNSLSPPLIWPVVSDLTPSPPPPPPHACVFLIGLHTQPSPPDIQGPVQLLL